MGMSDSAILDRIRMCKKRLALLEQKEKNEKTDQEKEDIEYELECWRNMLEYGTVSMW